jgi:predicted RNA-binding Zn ribbon-like protein
MNLVRRCHSIGHRCNLYSGFDDEEEPTLSATGSTTPAEVELVRSFVNTIDYEDGTEQLGSPAGLHDWMVAHDRLSAGTEVTTADLDRAVRLRDGLRSALTSHHDGEPDEEALLELDEVCAELPLRAVCSADGLAPCGTGIEGALAEIAAAAATARIKGSWARLKICPADDCGWAFYDVSRNRSRRWCSMEVCGNRNKVRAFRDRTRD